MPTLKLSKKVVDNLPPCAAAYVAYDSSLAGFGCRVMPTGTKSWIVEYRPHGGGRRIAKKRVTLGRTSAIPPERARQAAKEILARVQLGEDVAAERAALRRATTVGELAERYMTEEIRPTRKRRTAALYESYLRNYILPELSTRRAREVTRADATRLHRKIGATTPATCAIADEVRPLGIEVRAGLHTGECEMLDHDVSGIAVHIGARVAALARQKSTR